MQTYDNGVAVIFEMPTSDSRSEVSLNYVGVLQDILKLEYGPVRTPIILFPVRMVQKG